MWGRLHYIKNCVASTASLNMVETRKYQSCKEYPTGSQFTDRAILAHKSAKRNHVGLSNPPFFLEKYCLPKQVVIYLHIFCQQKINKSLVYNVLYLQNLDWEAEVALVEVQTHTQQTLLQGCPMPCGSRHGGMPNLLARNLNHSLSPHPRKMLCPLVQYCTVCPHSSVINQNNRLLEERFHPSLMVTISDSATHTNRCTKKMDLLKYQSLKERLHGSLHFAWLSTSHNSLVCTLLSVVC
jgi:hypothetical protein